MDVSGRAPARCAFCAQAEVMVARAALRLDAALSENTTLRARNTELVADNRRLRLALGHPRPALSLIRSDEEMG
jgi:hypothetical protein